MASSAPPKFPSISHPLSRLGSREALSISGKSRDGSVSVDWSLGTTSPQLPIRSHSVAGSYLSQGRDESAIGSRCFTSHDSRRITTEEVLLVLEERLRSGNFHAVKKLFRSNDPKGEGNVTKEAFSRILWNLCGYLSPRKISHVLKRMGLDKRSSIAFEDLVLYFRRPMTGGGGRESLKTPLFQKMPKSAPDRYSLRSPAKSENGLGRYCSPEEEAEQSWSALRAMAGTGELHFEDLFPPMCFGDGAYIIPGQLRECLQKLKIPSSDDIVARILRRLDGGSPYAIRTSTFFQHLGLNEKGKMASKAETSREYKQVKEVKAEKIDEPKVAPETIQFKEDQPKISLGIGEDLPRASSTLNIHPARPKTSMDLPTKIYNGDVMEMVTKKLDEGQLQFIRSLESKQQTSSGMISKADLRAVLRQIGGLNLTATTLEHFLSKNGLRRKDGMVNYKLLVRRLQTRSRRGTLSKVMKNQDHIFHEDFPPSMVSETVTANHLEAKLIDIFHREFLVLLNIFREFDPSGTGLLTLDEFKTALENKFSVSITQSAWESFLASGQIRFVQPPNTATDGRDGYVAYNDFLAKFDVILRPATVDADDPWAEDKGQVERLREHKSRYLKSMATDPADHTHTHEPRSLEQLEATLLDVFLYKFQNFKKEYDLIVREDFCRIDKEKFDYILFRCGFVLTPSELSRLWLSLPITRPMESLSMPTILQQVMRIYYVTTMPGKFSKSSRDSAIVSHILEKIRCPVVTHWKRMKKKLRYLDPMGTSRIDKTEMLQILRRLPVDITDLELHYLIEMLESRISGKTNYFRLMEYYVKNSKTNKLHENDIRPLLSTDSQRIYPKVYGGRDLPKQHDYRHPTPKKPQYITLRNAPATPPFKRVNVHPGYPKIYKKKSEEEDKRDLNRPPESAGYEHFANYRGALEFLSRHPPSANESDATRESLAAEKIKPRIGARDLPFMGRAMRREDKNDCGRISVEAFLKILSKYGVSFRDPNEVYKLLSRYDRKLRDEISYEKFLRALA